MKKRHPKIAVTGPDSGGAAAWMFTALSVLIAGGLPLRIRPSKPRNLDGVDGLIIGGGADIDPSAYEKKGFMDTYLDQTFLNKRKSYIRRVFSFLRRLLYPFIFIVRRLFSVRAYKIDKARDRLEFSLVKEALRRQLPIVGICRGAQLINVYFKGDLYQEIEPLYQEEVNRASIFPIKKVTLSPGSKLSEILCVQQLMVNALHHQAVKEPGEGIIIAAREDNGIVQAIESTQYEFVIGVQWHPEYLLNKRIHRRIFRALIQQACHIYNHRKEA